MSATGAEIPATGTAAAALPGFLAERQRLPAGTTRWQLRQGDDACPHESGDGPPQPDRAEADIAAGALTVVRVGGTAVLIGRGSLDVPPSRLTWPPQTNPWRSIES